MKFSLYTFPFLALSSTLACALPAEEKVDSGAKVTQSLKESKDFINFRNDDLLHGKFLGFTTSGKVIWNNMAAEKNIAFQPKEVRKIVINKGQLNKPFTHTSYVTLTNQDTIPGKIVAISDKFITLQSDYAGEIKIPKNTVSSIDFQPLGDKIQFRGPFTDTDWEAIIFNSAGDTSKSKKEKELAWKFKNFSLQNAGLPGAIMLKEEMKDKSRFIFKVSTLNSSMPSFFIAADKVIPDVQNDENDEKNKRVATSRYTHLSKSIGTSLVFKLTSYNCSVSFYSFDDKGNPIVENLPNMLVSTRMNRQKPENYVYDVRIDKQAGNLLLYSNGNAIGQWDIAPYTAKLKGNKMGFANLYRSNINTSAISDIVVSTWNGVMDPAASMENDDRDTILLTNGTDRYSGKALKIENDKMLLKGAYAELAIPTDQIQSLYFASKGLEELSAKEDDEVSVRFYGTGRITGTLAKGENGKIIIDSKVLGKLTVDLAYISAYEFEDMDFAYEIIK